MTASVVDTFTEAGLTGREQYVVAELRLGRELRTVRQDPELVRLFGRAPSYQTVANIGAAGQAKLGVPGTVHAVSRAEAAERLVERGQLVRTVELHGEARSVGCRLTDRERAQRELEDLATAFLEEVERDGLSPERKAYYLAECERIEQAVR